MKLFGILLLSLGLLSSCVVKEELQDGIREMRPSVTGWDLKLGPDRTANLDFTFHYELGIVDEDGIESLQWVYQIHTVSQNVLAENEQEMRKAEPEKTEILVKGDRKRSLSIASGLMTPGGTYVLHFFVYYRGELLKELLLKVVEGEDFETEPVDSVLPPSF